MNAQYCRICDRRRTSQWTWFPRVPASGLRHCSSVVSLITVASAVGGPRGVRTLGKSVNKCAPNSNLEQARSPSG